MVRKCYTFRGARKSRPDAPAQPAGGFAVPELAQCAPRFEGRRARPFPTSHRAASSGMFSVLETLGGVTGLLGLYFYGTQDTAEMSVVIPAIATTNILGALVLLGFPETKQRTLEDIH